MFPLNYVQYGQAAYRRQAEAMLAECQAANVGVMIIKAVARGRWGAHEHTHPTWYEPFSRPDLIQPAVNFVLSQPVTGLCTAGDPRLLPLQLAAFASYSRLAGAEQEALIASAAEIQPLFA